LLQILTSFFDCNDINSLINGSWTALFSSFDSSYSIQNISPPLLYNKGGQYIQLYNQFLTSKFEILIYSIKISEYSVNIRIIKEVLRTVIWKKIAFRLEFPNNWVFLSRGFGFQFSGKPRFSIWNLFHY
jgi:hypothetical protein